MTREETTKRFKKWAQQTIGNHGSDEDVQMFENILALLEQEPCDDCISRKATLEPYRVLENTDTLCVALIRANIKQQPPVTPQPKIGWWLSFGVQGEIDGQIVRAFTCSECGAISIFRLSGGNIVNGDLCPNCGAKMEESEDTE